jgi:hypothetical protein
MVEYEKRKVLYSFIGVGKNPKTHWSNSSSWIMAKFMYAQVINAIVAIVSIANYVAFTCDEVNMVDNGNWISIHAYVMQNWVRILILISLQKVVSRTRVNDLTIVIMEALQKGGGLSFKSTTQKLIYFGDDGVGIFKEPKLGPLSK